MEDSITLIVKNANQQIDDYTVECSLNWTIHNLKRHLSDEYPCKPKIENQKLIYFGHMCNDETTLRDVLNKFGPAQPVHTFHLVFKPNTPMGNTRMSNANEGLNRVTPNTPSTTSSPQPPFVPADNVGTPRVNVPYNWTHTDHFINQPSNTWMNQPNFGYFQQLAAQQAYLQYYRNHYMDMVTRQRFLHVPNNHNFTGPGVYGNYEIPRVPLQEQQNILPQPQQPRAGVIGEDDDRRPNRDWLDYAHVFSRLVVLFAIVYFYSSPARFLVVSFLGFFLYLYHVGFFRLPMPVENNEMLNGGNLVMNNNNNLHNNNNNVVQQEVPAAAAIVNNNIVDDDAVAAQPPRNFNGEDNNAGAIIEVQPSVIALTWTFLSSFFTSLIPDNQNET